ncbi:L-lysine 6-monooxygenase (NADPH-requiring)-domain-containing protein [Microdochium trichocladiopsis]|uniref:L-ornithine N(5)-monooxygenase [NAD(P)H] n=1 Tax=Microdochium trichocladiopsis TaxID=1682393 RepID=A0A9P8Y2Z6_9PEZI|nr:L-lysine 6-monooxygenase (NADPH-requiring)-domain-containing protein [Microdochium trichocladiopsis]KAH7027948.1 L-lysine 6-monooxygenase (NADPH-requiring)-domain-containing protein [Microdochium trichocladiopsis]
MAPHSFSDSSSDSGDAYSGFSHQKQAPRHSNGTTPKRTSHLRRFPSEEVHDLVCVGFGPASLAVAVALNDNIQAGRLGGRDGGPLPKVRFLEKQPRFAWHAGMLLPGAKMQISFMKDMATFRDPRSHFTFVNYLHQNERLADFTNLSTFTPARSEFEDYLRWCSSHFDDVVDYGSEVLAVSPDNEGSADKVSTFTVTSRSGKSGVITKCRARNVLIAIGGQPSFPKQLPQKHPRVIHSSQYATLVPKILNKPNAPYRVAVLGGGQSAAEIFNNIQNLYPNSSTSLVMRAEFLKPSDDSPFVNSIFNPDYVDDLYQRPEQLRRQVITGARATNYSVVRLDLIEHLFEKMYDQRRELGADEKQWPHRIRGNTDLVSCTPLGDDKVRLAIRPTGSVHATQEYLDVDLVISATGYQRNGHLGMIEQIESLLPESEGSAQTPAGKAMDYKFNPKVGSRDLRVTREYAVKFAPGKVAQGSGMYLQGTNEGSHGLSDTLLSILAVRSGEVVDAMFGLAPRERAML